MLYNMYTHIKEWYHLCTHMYIYVVLVVSRFKVQYEFIRNVQDRVPSGELHEGCWRRGKAGGWQEVTTSSLATSSGVTNFQLRESFEKYY